MTSKEADQLAKRVSQDGEWNKVTSTNGVCQGRRTVSYSVSRERSIIGPAVGEGTFLLDGPCVQVAAATTPPQDRPRALKFAASILGSNANLPSSGPPSAAHLQTPSIDQRLATLKDLADRKLITPSEYEAKRKEILGGL